MEILFTLFSFVAICVIGLFIASVFRLPSTVSPFIAVCFTMVYFVLFGVFGGLLIGGYLYFLAAVVISLLFAVKKIKLPKISLWFGGFVAISVAMIIFFGVREPLLYSWDEFSFWGTAVKLTKINHELHTTAEIGWAWVASQKAGLLMLGYLFEFFGEYAEWRIFAGLNVLALSVFTAMLTPIKATSKHIGIILFAVMFFIPYGFTVNRALIEPSNVYMNAHSDVPMAWVFCGVLILYFVLKNTGEHAISWAVPLALAALTNTRDTALPFALIAWVIIAVDMFLVSGDSLRANIKRKILDTVVMLSVILVSFFGWSQYIAAATGADPLGNVGGSDELSMTAMLIEGVSQLFGFGTTEHFSQVMSKMLVSYFTLPLSMIGSGFMITVVIVGILAIAAIFTQDKTTRKRAIFFGVLSTLGFIAYYVFIGFTFVFIFKDDVSTELLGYERYLYPYYIAWFSVSVFLLAESSLRPRKRLFLAPFSALLLVLAVFVLRFYQYVPSGMAFFDYHDGYLYEREKTVETAKDVVNLLGEDEDGKIYFLSQGDNGNRWFQFAGDILPLQLDYSFGGGSLSLPKSGGEGLYDYELSPTEFVEYLEENECEFIFVERSDESLVSDFGHMFDDNLSASTDGASVVYGVTQDDEVPFVFLGEVGA